MYENPIKNPEKKPIQSILLSLQSKNVSGNTYAGKFASTGILRKTADVKHTIPSTKHTLFMILVHGIDNINPAVKLINIW